jgi:hypothetical protein
VKLPDKVPQGRERWFVAGLVLVTGALFAAEILRDFSLVKLSVPLMMLYVLPLTALHEAGHALVSHVLGWQVCRVVVGYGPNVFRFRVRSVPVDLRLWPLGGYVIPAPRKLSRPRLESALIYAAGPAAEALPALLLLWLLGPERLLSRTDELGTLAAQALLTLVAIDLFFNLLPLPVESERGQGLTDGLGMLLSPFRSRAHFLGLMTVPWVVRAERISDDPARQVAILREGVATLPENPFMRLELADALLRAGEPFEAHAERTAALESAELSDEQRRELKKQRQSLAD